MLGMREVVCSSVEEHDAAVAEAEAKGERVACMSNAGLPRGQARLTFLPASCFTDNQAKKETNDAHD